VLCAWVACLFLLWSAPPARAEQGAIPGDEGEIEIGNLVTSQVQSQTGYQFVKYFNDYWTAPEGLGSVNIVIQERASPIWGSMIWVKVNDAIIYRQIFSSRAKDMKETGRSAVEMVMSYILTTRLGSESNVIEDGPLDEL
jgi:hypothetical protein